MSGTNAGRKGGRKGVRNCFLDCGSLKDARTNLLRTSIQETGLSARAHDKILRVARTIADLDGSGDIRPEHVSEAVNYRTLDRQFWS